VEGEGRVSQGHSGEVLGESMNSMLRDRSYLVEAAKTASRSNVTNLHRKDRLIVYHATYDKEFELMANGIDALRVRSRSYNQGNHRGLFVAPTKDVAKRFGRIVIKLSLPVRSMHSPIAWGGGIDSKKEDKIWKEFFPNSFRPSLSASLADKGAEPQALYVGFVRPKDILAVYNYGNDDKPSEPMSLKDAKKFYSVDDVGVDVTNPKMTIKQFMQAMDLGKYPEEKLRSAVMRGDRVKNAQDIEALILRGGFGDAKMIGGKALRNVSKRMAKKWGLE